jgi:hypothetical protein
MTVYCVGVYNTGLAWQQARTSRNTTDEKHNRQGMESSPLRSVFLFVQREQEPRG